jgi:hypothetical protein
MIVSAAATVAAMLTAPGATAATAAPAAADAGAIRCPHVTQPPPEGLDSRLNGVGVVSACNAWAVGFDSSGAGAKTLIYHWNGSLWAQVASPNPGAAPASDSLNAISVVSASDAWAVGSSTSADVSSALIEHWTGAKWEAVASPKAGGATGQSILQGIWAASAKSIWVVGYTVSGPHSSVSSLIEHWNGANWKTVGLKLTGPGKGTFLSAVSGTSAKQIWATGFYCPTETKCVPTILAWNGNRWRRSSIPSLPAADSGFLYGISAFSKTSAWAVGTAQKTSAGGPLIEHWNGHTWSRMKVAYPPSSFSTLEAVQAISAKEAIAVGMYQPEPTGLQTSLTITWNGTKWATGPVRDPLGAGLNYSLNAVGGYSCATTWLVGDGYKVSNAERPAAVRC